MFQEFPVWVTHESGESRIVETEDAFVALGEGWKKPERAKPVAREKQADFLEYPKWVGDKIVHSAEEEAALKPLAADAKDVPALDPAEEKAALLQIADEKGVKVDKRWANEKIRAALEAV